MTLQYPALHFPLHTSYSSPYFGQSLQAAEDVRVDAQLEQYCKGDISTFCADVTPGEGRIQDCLVCETPNSPGVGCCGRYLPHAAPSNVGCI